jgi:hypothetical protein
MNNEDITRKEYRAHHDHLKQHRDRIVHEIRLMQECGLGDSFITNILRDDLELAMHTLFSHRGQRIPSFCLGQVTKP